MECDWASAPPVSGIIEIAQDDNHGDENIKAYLGKRRAEKRYIDAVQGKKGRKPSDQQRRAPFPDAHISRPVVFLHYFLDIFNNHVVRAFLQQIFVFPDTFH